MHWPGPGGQGGDGGGRPRGGGGGGGGGGQVQEGAGVHLLREGVVEYAGFFPCPK